MKIVEEWGNGPGIFPDSSASLARGSIALQVLVVLATLLFVGQLLVGTSPEFAGAVYLALLVVSTTLYLIGFATVAGILVAYMAFRYLVFSQFIKTFYGQPGDSNLQAPETTITLLLVGFTIICGAALLVSKVIGNRKIVSVSPSADTLAFVRNVSLCCGLFSYVMLRGSSVTDSGDTAYGGGIAIARQFGMFTYVAILAETWRALQLSEGRKSTSITLYTVIGALVAVGFLLNSKGAMASPVLMYLFASCAYRGYVTKAQVTMGAVVLVVGVLVAYPAVQLTRKDRGDSGLITLDLAGDYLYRLITDPTSLFDDWQDYLKVPDQSLFTESLEYLGTVDDLRGRFMLIANTDVIANAVNQDGPYGPELIENALRSIVPTVIDPDKPRVYSGDLLTWHYGLRNWGVAGFPTIGLFADCYAAWSWPGVVLVLAVLMPAFFFALALPGTRLGGNFLATYLAFRFFHTFGEGTISGIMGNMFRDIPIELGLLVGMVYLADLVANRRERILANRLWEAGITSGTQAVAGAANAGDTPPSQRDD